MLTPTFCSTNTVTALVCNHISQKLSDQRLQKQDELLRCRRKILKGGEKRGWRTLRCSAPGLVPSWLSGTLCLIQRGCPALTVDQRGLAWFSVAHCGVLLLSALQTQPALLSPWLDLRRRHLLERGENSGEEAGGPQQQGWPSCGSGGGCSAEISGFQYSRQWKSPRRHALQPAKSNTEDKIKITTRSLLRVACLSVDNRQGSSSYY